MRNYLTIQLTIDGSKSEPIDIAVKSKRMGERLQFMAANAIYNYEHPKNGNHYICGACGKVDLSNEDTAECLCGADNFIELGDIFYDELRSYVNSAVKKTGLSREEMLKILLS